MTNILIVDDHAIVCRGLKQIVVENFDGALIEEARDAPEALEQVRSRRWDLVILDITLPSKSGLEVLKEIKRERPKLPVLVLSVYPEDLFGFRILKAGGAGYITKESAPDELVKAIRKVLAGGKYVSASLAEKLVIHLGTDTEKLPYERLSDREFEILCLIASGKTVSEIARQLSLSVKTVSTHRTRILEKMQMRTSAELTHYAIYNRLVE